MGCFTSYQIQSNALVNTYSQYGVLYLLSDPVYRSCQHLLAVWNALLVIRYSLTLLSTLTHSMVCFTSYQIQFNAVVNTYSQYGVLY